jgi:intein/homing endonuclease
MADANDKTASVPAPEGSGLVTSNLDAEFKMIKNAVSPGLTGSALVDIPRARMKKMASQFGNMRPGLHRQAPSFYHPLFEALNLQLPTKTKEINQWSFPKGTKVLMADLVEKNIEDIVSGEEVITHLGRVKEVVKTYVHETDRDEKLFKIEARGLPIPLEGTSKHPFMVIRKKEATCVFHDKQRCRPQQLRVYCEEKGCSRTKLKPVWVHAEDLRPGDCVLTPIYRTENKSFELSIDMARLFGYYSSEGSLNWSGAQFSFHEKETQYVDEIRTIANRHGSNITVKPHSKSCLFGHGVTVSLFSRKIAREFLRHCGRGSHNKKFSREVMALPPSVQRHILGTIINGDGNQSITWPVHGTVRIATVSDALASQLVHMFARCDVVARTYKENNERGITKDKKGSVINFVAIKPQDANKFLDVSDLQFTDIKHPRQECFIYGNYIVRPIDSISSRPCREKVYNLSVVDDNSYVASGIVVSNCRHFYKTDGYVGTVLDMHSDLPMTGAHLVCDDEKVKLFFEILFFDVIKGLNLIGDVSHEWWKLGNVFPFGEWDDDRGIWTGFNLLNPDFVEVEKSSLVGEPILKLDPDDNLKRIVASRQPKELYEALAKIENGQLVNLVARGEKIPLNKFRVSHLAYKMSPYESVGTPIMFRAFKPLIFKDLVRRVQQAVYERHITPIKLVKVGTDTMPANPQAVTQVREAFDELSQDLSAWFVYHHAISVEYVSSAGKIHPFDQESKWIREEIMAALMGSEAMIGGTGPNFAAGSIGLQVLINRYMRCQEMLARWIKDTIFRPVAIAQDFRRRNELGEDEYIVPDIEFEFMKLKDDVQMKGLMKEMAKTGLISKQTFYTYLGLDYRKEKRQIERERAEEKKAAMQGMKPGGKPGAGGAGAPPPMGGGGGGDSGGGEGPVPGEGETAATVPTPGTPMPAAETIPGAGAGQGLPEAA